ncbi:DUF1624 domain-containing protein [Phreatobacter aquaticus]|uniref:DUF1624 domain-containing protein n=2 Tax=Phreatobacter aquaticus TaxID=2570229 RepID=A0A4D7QID5_9HYPH|nr:DUF1624 domain-containing protein [Phreatobacter aquaticus]
MPSVARSRPMTEDQTMIPSSTLSPPSRRLDMIDALRGVALLGMFAYHLSWDLAYLGFVRQSLPFEPAMAWFAHAVAGSFLALAGAGLVLADDRGRDRAAYLRRLALVAGAATLVTIVSYFAMPQAMVTFGILHLIALMSVLGLPFLRMPRVVAALAAIVVAALPLAFRSPAFDHPTLAWLGLSTTSPNSIDFVPLFPWAAAVLAGIVAMRAILESLPDGAWAHWRAEGRFTRLLVWGGRRSLWIYLVHQPVFLALLFGLANVTGVRPATVDRGELFMNDCRSNCAASGGSADICQRACSCTADNARAAGLWDRLITNRLTPEQTTQIGEMARACVPQRRRG